MFTYVRSYVAKRRLSLSLQTKVIKNSLRGTIFSKSAFGVLAADTDEGK